MNRLIGVALALTIAQSGFVLSGREAEDPGAAAEVKSKYGPADVEVRMRDGSSVRGELIGPEMLTLKTAYGTLSFPITRLVQVRVGLRTSKTDDTEIVAAIKDLDNDEFTIRGQAEKKLESVGSRAATLLREARKKASPEARTHIEALLKKITTPDVNTDADDTVKADEFEAAGKLELEALQVKSRIGDLKVKLVDIESVRWLASGVAKALTLDGTTAMQEWMDTGIDSNPGDKMVVSCSGSINLFSSVQCTPEGTNNWGNRGSFQMGAVVGRMGVNGKPFLIGNAKSWTAQTRARLYLKIYCSEEMMNRNGNPTTGSYAIKASTGVWTEAGAAEETGN